MSNKERYCGHHAGFQRSSTAAAEVEVPAKVKTRTTENPRGPERAKWTRTETTKAAVPSAFTLYCRTIKTADCPSGAVESLCVPDKSKLQLECAGGFFFISSICLMFLHVHTHTHTWPASRGIPSQHLPPVSPSERWNPAKQSTCRRPLELKWQHWLEIHSRDQLPS